MSRIGKLPIKVPEGVQVTIAEDNIVTVKGPKGELHQKVDKDIKVRYQDNQILVERPTDQKRHKSMHGLYRSLIKNMVDGTSNGFTRQLELVGVGYRASLQEQLLDLNVGYSHHIIFSLPTEIKASIIVERGKNAIITLESNDKQLLGQVAAKIRSIRKPEPYKGKGIKYVEEIIRKKAGKTAGAEAV